MNFSTAIFHAWQRCFNQVSCPFRIIFFNTSNVLQGKTRREYIAQYPWKCHLCLLVYVLKVTEVTKTLILSEQNDLSLLNRKPKSTVLMEKGWFVSKPIRCSILNLPSDRLMPSDWNRVFYTVVELSPSEAYLVV